MKSELLLRKFSTRDDSNLFLAENMCVLDPYLISKYFWRLPMKNFVYKPNTKMILEVNETGTNIDMEPGSSLVWA